MAEVVNERFITPLLETCGHPKSQLLKLQDVTVGLNKRYCMVCLVDKVGLKEVPSSDWPKRREEEAFRVRTQEIAKEEEYL